MLKDFTKEKFDILIQAGQSNSDGTSFGPTAEPYVPDDRVWYLNDDGTITKAAESVSGNLVRTTFALQFARRYLAAGLLEEGRKLLVVRSAVGGTGFLDKRWGMTDDLYLQMMEMTRTALALNPQNRLCAFLWHQGETDAIFNASYDTHYTNLTTLINSVRGTFAVPELPVIAGDFVADWKSKNEEICKPVLEAIRAICCDLKPAAFVETADLKSNGQENTREFYDDIHFSRDSCYILGDRYFEAYTALLQK